MTISQVGSDLWSFGRVGQLALNTEALTESENVLQDQASTGLASTSIASLGTSTQQVLDLQPQVAQLTALQSNATVAAGRLTAASTALGAMSSIAQTLSTGLLGLVGSSDDFDQASVSALSATAKAQLSSLGALLNTRVGDSYVFAGQAETVAPVPDPSSLVDGPLATSVSTSLSGLSGSGAGATLQAIFAAAANTTEGETPFAASLAQTPPMTVPVGTDEVVATGVSLTATDGAAAGTSGSAIRDLVAELTTVASLSSVDPASGGYAGLIAGLRTAVGNTQASLTALTGANGIAQQTVTAASALSKSVSDALTGRIGDLTSVDLSTVSVQLTATENQLQASYMLIKDLGSLTLTAYL